MATRFLPSILPLLAVQSVALGDPPRYSAIVIEPPVPDRFITPTAITPAGDMVGYIAPTRDEYPIVPAIIRAGLHATPLESPDIPGFAWGVSPDGSLVCGSSGFRQCVWVDGEIRYLEGLIEGGLPLFGPFGAPHGASDEGVLVGELDTDLPYFEQAVYWPSVTSNPRYLRGLIPEISPGRASAINGAGQVLGSARIGVDSAERYAVIWDSVGSEPRILGTLPGARTSDGLGLNDRGDAVGVSHTPEVFVGEAFLYESDTGEMIGLGFLPDATMAYSEARGVNAARQVVGMSNAGEGISHAFLWQAGELHDLNDLVDPIPGVQWLADARAINDAGQIAAEGVVEEGLGFSNRVIVLLTPIGCPADLTGDGVADSADFFAYLDLFAAGDSEADITGNGVIDADDFFAYLDLFAVSC